MAQLIRYRRGQPRGAGCRWLHVDFEPACRSFYMDACGFTPSLAGLIDLEATFSCQSYELGSHSGPLTLRSYRGVEEEGVEPSIPGDVDEAHETSFIAGSDLTEAVSFEPVHDADLIVAVLAPGLGEQ